MSMKAMNQEQLMSTPPRSSRRKSSAKSAKSAGGVAKFGKSAANRTHVIEIQSCEDKTTQTKTWDHLASEVSLAIDMAALEGRRITWFGSLGN